MKCLETKRLLLRPFTIEDAPAIYKNYASNPQVTKYLSWEPHQSVTDSEEIIKTWVEQYQNPLFYQWAIIYKLYSTEPIGSIGVVSTNDSIGKNKNAEVGYCIGEEWWHQGITSEALQIVIDFLFDEVGLNRIEARHDSQNPYSGAVMRKCGMKYEGTKRQAVCNNQGIYVDICWYAILADER